MFYKHLLFFIFQRLASVCLASEKRVYSEWNMIKYE